MNSTTLELEEIKQLEELAAPLIQFLRDNGNPHCEIRIEYDRAVWIEEVCGTTPVPLL